MNGLSTVGKPVIEDPNEIVRQWTSCPFIYEDSRKRVPNPDYHYPVCQNRAGKFVDIEGRPIPLNKVPEYIRLEGKSRLAATPEPERRELTLADAMQEAEASNTRASAPAPKPTRRRARRAA